MAGETQALLSQLLGVAGDFAGGALRVFVKTNFGPEVEVGRVELGGGGSSSTGTPGGVSGLLGFKAGVILRDAQGRYVAKLGEPPATEPVRVVLVLGVVLAAVLLIVRGLRR